MPARGGHRAHHRAHHYGGGHKHRSGGGRTVFLGIHVATLRTPVPNNCIDLPVIPQLSTACGTPKSPTIIVPFALPNITREEFNTNIEVPLTMAYDKAEKIRSIRIKIMGIIIILVGILGLGLLIGGANDPDYMKNTGSFSYRDPERTSPILAAGIAIFVISFFVLFTLRIWTACCLRSTAYEEANSAINACNSSSSITAKGIKVELVKISGKQLLVPPVSMRVLASWKPPTNIPGTYNDPAWNQPPSVPLNTGISLQLIFVRLHYPADMPIPADIQALMAPASTYVYPFTGNSHPFGVIPTGDGELPYTGFAAGLASAAATTNIMAPGAIDMTMMAGMTTAMTGMAIQQQQQIQQQLFQQQQQQFQQQQIPVAQPIVFSMMPGYTGMQQQQGQGQPGQYNFPPASAVAVPIPDNVTNLANGMPKSF